MPSLPRRLTVFAYVQAEKAPLYRSILEQALETALRLPVSGQTLPELAASITGDSHALDSGKPLATLVLQAVSAWTGRSIQDAASRREAWAEVGVFADDPDTHLRILHEGVVLVDEMEEHLHVTWQREIGFWLKRHFPNLQFIVTTHSPFICQAADPGGLIRFPAPGEDRSVEHVSEDLYHTVVHGSLDDAVLTELFGLQHSYLDESEDLRERVSELEARLQEGQLDAQGRRELERLRKQLPTSPSTDVEMELRKLLVEG